MLKKILIGIGVALLALAGTGYFMMEQMRKKSPATEVQTSMDDLSVTVKYGAPSVRGRVIFADGEEALQPFGKYWRLGANEMTTIEFSGDVSFQGEPVPAGVYGMYVIPEQDVFTLILNQEADRWGWEEADHSLDIVKVKALTSRKEQVTETLSIIPKEIDDAIELNMSWEYYNWSVTIKPI